MNGDKFQRFPISEVTRQPEGGTAEVKINKWWAVTENDCILCYHGYSWQCNDDRRVTDIMIGYKDHPASKSVLLPLVFLPRTW